MVRRTLTGIVVIDLIQFDRSSLIGSEAVLYGPKHFERSSFKCSLSISYMISRCTNLYFFSINVASTKQVNLNGDCISYFISIEL